MRIQVHSCIREVDRIVVRERRQCCLVRTQEEGMHVVSKIRRADRMKIALEDSKRGNTAAMKERLKTVSQRKGVNEMKSLHLPCPTGLMTTADTPPRASSILHTWTD